MKTRNEIELSNLVARANEVLANLPEWVIEADTFFQGLENGKPVQIQDSLTEFQLVGIFAEFAEYLSVVGYSQGARVFEGLKQQGEKLANCEEDGKI